MVCALHDVSCQVLYAPKWIFPSVIYITESFLPVYMSYSVGFISMRACMLGIIQPTNYWDAQFNGFYVFGTVYWWH